MSRTQPISIFQGEKLVGIVNVSNKDISDITGFTWEMEVRDSAGVMVWDSDNTAEITISQVDSKHLQFVVEAGDTQGVDPGVYPYDLFRVDAGNQATLIDGNITIKSRVTLYESD